VSGGERYDETREDMLKSVWLFGTYLRHSFEVYEDGELLFKGNVGG
jgi:hypothetical protein